MTTDETYTQISELIDQAVQHHRQGQHVLSLQCYQKAIELAAPLGDTSTTAFLLIEAGSEHRDCDNYYHAIDLMIAALALIPDGPETLSERARVKKSLAIAFSDVYGAKKPEVMQLLEESRAEYALIGDSGAEANVLQHIGDCYVDLGRLREADDILQEALKRASSASDVQLQGWILNDMAELEIEREEWGLALEYTLKAREKLHAVQDLEIGADTWITEARIQLRMGHAKDALPIAERALEMYIQNKNLRRSIRARHHLAKILNKLGRTDEAIVALHEGMKIAERLDLRYYQALMQLDLGYTERERKNYGLVCQYGTKAKEIAEHEGMRDLLDEADELLEFCPDN